MKNLMISAVAFSVLCTGASAFALTKAELDSKVNATMEKCYKEVAACKDITSKSAGYLVFPEVTKGGVGVAYESGQGALMVGGKIAGYYKTSTTSLGATIGVGSKSMVVVFKTPAELDKFKKSSGWEVGADAGVAMMDSGKAGSLDSENVKADVVGIVFGESGVIADVSIKGSKISPIDAKDIG